MTFVSEVQTKPGATLRRVLFFSGLVVFAILLALGSWQVQRLFWKRDLIARVESRVQKSPVAIPASVDWAHVNRTDDEYRHVSVSGTYLHEHMLRTQAVTGLGSGYWLMTPLRMTSGEIVWINRGFISPDAQTRDIDMPAGTVSVSGLLRMSEPGGGFLRKNDVAHGRWYSRDVVAMSAAQGIGVAAPFFIDVDATPLNRPYPVGGLTVVRFADNHLIYALTWYAMAALLAGFWWRRRMYRSVR